MVVKAMIHIGDYWGRKYEYARYYLPFHIRTGIRYYNWHNHCMEAIRQRMYEVDGFIPQRGSVVYDIGANVGDYSLIWAKVYGAQVITFEPLPGNNAEILTNMLLNKPLMIRMVPSGLSDEDQSAIEVGYDGDMLDINNAGGKSATIYLARLDTLVPLFNLEKPDIIKIDVEGYEMKVLKGAVATIEAHNPKIIIETHSSDLRKQVQEFLGHLGYDLAHTGRTIKGKGWMDEVTNLFFNPGGIK